MVRKTTKKEIKEVVKTIRIYGNRMLEGLNDNEVTWVPENSKGRSIESYLRHLLNSEVYWYTMIKEGPFAYYSKKIGIDDLIDSFKKHESKILELIDIAEDDALELRIPEWEGENLRRKGTLAWIIYRTSMHAVHHFGQIAYIRFSLENPPADKINGHSDPWGYIMDQLVFLAHSDD